MVAGLVGDSVDACEPLGLGIVPAVRVGPHDTAMVGHSVREPGAVTVSVSLAPSCATDELAGTAPFAAPGYVPSVPPAVAPDPLASAAVLVLYAGASGGVMKMPPAASSK